MKFEAYQTFEAFKVYIFVFVVQELFYFAKMEKLEDE